MNTTTQKNKLSNFINSIQKSIDQESVHNFMTVREVALELNCHQNTVFRTIATGDLKAHNISVNKSGKRSYRISREALENYLADRVAQSM